MASVEERIVEQLERQDYKELVEAWRQICALYEEGGPPLVESYFVKKIKEIRSKFVQEIKEIESDRSIVRAKKMRRRK